MNRRGVRRWGERGTMALVVLYLAVGVLAGENLKHWLDALPFGFGKTAMQAFTAFHLYNPFGMMQCWTDWGVEVVWEKAAWLEAGALAATALLLVRGARRLERHFHELHYHPIALRPGAARPPVGDRPLSWWAVRRVTRYSGRINLWLAGGFGLLYALYTAAGPHWPAWMGQRVFQIFDQMGGVAGLATGLVVLAAVPAAYQYGLWDSNAHDRCRRLELLLLSGLDARDYWNAAAAAAWKRGRGYFAVALLLWASAVVAGRMTAGQAARGRGGGRAAVGAVFHTRLPGLRARDAGQWLRRASHRGAASDRLRAVPPRLAGPGRAHAAGGCLSRRRRRPGVHRIIRTRNGRRPYAGRRPPVAGFLRPRPPRLVRPQPRGEGHGVRAC